MAVLATDELGSAAFGPHRREPARRAGYEVVLTDDNYANALLIGQAAG